MTADIEDDNMVAGPTRTGSLNNNSDEEEQPKVAPKVVKKVIKKVSKK
jgi:hypothetical protein